jgi:hypothetical protein
MRSGVGAFWPGAWLPRDPLAPRLLVPDLLPEDLPVDRAVGDLAVTDFPDADFGVADLAELWCSDFPVEVDLAAAEGFAALGTVAELFADAAGFALRALGEAAKPEHGARLKEPNNSNVVGSALNVISVAVKQYRGAPVARLGGAFVLDSILAIPC